MCNSSRGKPVPNQPVNHTRSEHEETRDFYQNLSGQKAGITILYNKAARLKAYKSRRGGSRAAAVCCRRAAAPKFSRRILPRRGGVIIN